MTERDDLPPELRALIEGERAAGPPPGISRVAVKAQLAASVAHLPLGHAAVGATLGGAGKALAVIAIAIAAGAGTGEIKPRATASTPAPMSSSAPAVASHAPRAAEVSPAPASPPSPPAAVVSATSPRRPAATSPTVTPRTTIVPSPRQSQPALLREAWAALSAGEAARALDLVTLDARLHPVGQLAEERAALQIRALMGAGRDEEARAAATRFVHHHPNSVHREAIELALESEEEP